MAESLSAEALYSRELLRLAASIPDQCAIAELPDAKVLRSPTCGSRIAMVVDKDEAGRVLRVTSGVEACAFGQAATHLVARHAVGMDRQEIDARFDATQIWLDGNSDEEPWPGFAVLAPARSTKARHDAILLPLRALKEAMTK